jgi:hypothetical protein
LDEFTYEVACSCTKKAEEWVNGISKKLFRLGGLAA